MQCGYAYPNAERHKGRPRRRPILECAAAAKSDYIVSEDKDLLRLGQYDDARILTIADFIQIVAEQGRGR